MPDTPIHAGNGAGPEANLPEIVITGMGVVSPIGIGTEPFWSSLCRRQSGVGHVTLFDGSTLPSNLAAEVDNFEPKKYVRPRKSLKVMNRDIQLGFAAADLACEDAEIRKAVEPERFGVVFGADMLYSEIEELASAFRSCVEDHHFDFDHWGTDALANVYPLWLLKYLPNMPACHIAIAQDARGPNNSITLVEVSSPVAIAEAMRVIERGQADVVVSGGASSRVYPNSYLFRVSPPLSRRVDDPASACRPFDADRDGLVHGEGAAAYVLENRNYALARGAKILARVLGYGNTFEPAEQGVARTTTVKRAIQQAMRSAGLQPGDLGHVNADGLGTIDTDRNEARAIRETLGDVPVTALKSYFGNLGAGSGAVEMAASVLSYHKGEVPVTLNYEKPDPDCPVNVIHDSPLAVSDKPALLLSIAHTGHAAALVIAPP